MIAAGPDQLPWGAQIGLLIFVVTQVVGGAAYLLKQANARADAERQINIGLVDTLVNRAVPALESASKALEVAQQERTTDRDRYVAQLGRIEDGIGEVRRSVSGGR